MPSKNASFKAACSAACRSGTAHDKQVCDASEQVYKGMGEAAAGIVQKQGVRGLYSGLGVTLLEIMPYAAMQFGLYDLFTAAFMRSQAATHVRFLACNCAFASPLLESFTAHSPVMLTFISDACRIFMAACITYYILVIIRIVQIAA